MVGQDTLENTHGWGQRGLTRVPSHARHTEPVTSRSPLRTPLPVPATCQADTAPRRGGSADVQGRLNQLPVLGSGPRPPALSCSSRPHCPDPSLTEQERSPPPPLTKQRAQTGDAELRGQEREEKQQRGVTLAPPGRSEASDGGGGVPRLREETQVRAAGPTRPPRSQPSAVGGGSSPKGPQLPGPGLTRDTLTWFWAMWRSLCLRSPSPEREGPSLPSRMWSQRGVLALVMEPRSRSWGCVEAC